MNLPMVDRVVNALLYEGYLLYPYRASAVKNQLRFNFGVVYPTAYAEAQSGNDASSMQTECLVTGGVSTALTIRVRFLRIVNRAGGEGGPRSWQEAVECGADLPVASIETLSAAPVRLGLGLPREQEQDGSIVRTREAIQAEIEARAEAVCDGFFRITVRVANLTGMAAGCEQDREAALASSLVSTHIVLGVEGGEFVSLLEPPEQLSEAASQCRNQGLWPVLVGEAGQRDTVLASPIILYDYPSIAPESPGDLFDGTEIDEILTLRVLTMTDQEKEEARSTDERARRLLERAESLNPEEFLKLHGTFRGTGEAS
jgi:hydrogenase maturation protease